MEEKNWIQELKAGDKVVVSTGSYDKKITSVTKITPKGFINVESGQTFTSDGNQRGGDTWHRTYLSQLTDEVALGFKKQALVNRCKVIQFNKLTVEQLEKILSILKEGE